VSFLDQSSEVQNQRILVTGASGFVGSRLIGHHQHQSRSEGMQFRAITRKPLVSDSACVEVHTIDNIDFTTDWSDALVGVDVVVHLAARVHVMNDHADNPLQEYRKANVASTLHLAQQAAMAGVKRFIFLSSIKVNGEKTKSGQPFTEESPPHPEDPYGVSKLEAEEGIRAISEQTGMEFVIIRPPLIYGPGVKANYLKLMQLVQRHFPLPLAGISNRRSMLALDNLIDFILLTAKHPQAANQLFLLSDGQSLSTAQLMNEIARAMGLASARLFAIPVPVLQLIAKCLGQSAAIERLTDSLEIDSQKASQLLQWNPPLSIQAGIQSTVDDFLLHQQGR
jgi:UDP-glucose 4-epimerase